MKYMQFLTNARAFAKQIGVKMDNGTAKTNGFGGYVDSEARLLPLKGDPKDDAKWRQNHRAMLVTTCYNCGDGTWVDITSAIINFKQ